MARVRGDEMRRSIDCGNFLLTISARRLCTCLLPSAESGASRSSFLNLERPEQQQWLMQNHGQKHVRARQALNLDCPWRMKNICFDCCITGRTVVLLTVTLVGPVAAMPKIQAF